MSIKQFVVDTILSSITPLFRLQSTQALTDSFLFKYLEGSFIYSDFCHEPFWSDA